MEKEFDGRVAVITGANRGIGLGIAKVLASKGCNIAIIDISGKHEEAVKEIKTFDVDCIGIKADISDTDSVNKAIEEIVKHYSKIDILVNNAGVMEALPLEDSSDKNRDFHINVNIKGPWNMTKAVLPYMKDKHYGRIITIASVTGNFVSDGDDTAYAMTKSALTGFSRSVAAYNAKYGITSNAICPGFIETEMAWEYAKECNPSNPKSVIDDIGKGLPIGRMGKPEDIGYLVSYLASEHAGFMTGSCIVIDGGCILPETSMSYIDK